MSLIKTNCKKCNLISWFDSLKLNFYTYKTLKNKTEQHNYNIPLIKKKRKKKRKNQTNSWKVFQVNFFYKKV